MPFLFLLSFSDFISNGKGKIRVTHTKISCYGVLRIIFTSIVFYILKVRTASVLVSRDNIQHEVLIEKEVK